MRPEEISSLQKFIVFNSDVEDSSKSKSAHLIELLMDKVSHTANDIQKIIYGKINYPAFNKLVNRLKEKTLEVLLFNSNLQRGYYSERSRTVFELRKRMIQIDLLILKGVRNKILDEINLIIKRADEFEIYDVLVQMNYTKQRFLGFDLSAKKIDRIKNEIRMAESKSSALNASHSLFNELILKISKSSNSLSYKSDLNKGLERLKSDFQLTMVPTIGYYYYLLLVESNQIEKSFQEAEENLKLLLKLLSKHKSVYSDYRKGSIELNLANNSLFLKKTQAALVEIEKARPFFQNQPLNLSILNEIQFYAYFYYGDISNSEKVITQLFDLSKVVNSPLVLSKIIYYSSCLFFIERNYPLALSRYNDCGEIDQDKEGWNVIKRIMITLCRIELEEYESVDLKLSNLDKFIKRVLKTKAIRPRFILIIRILRKLINENYDYSKVYLSRKKYFDLIESNDAEYVWEIKSPELIVFSEWFRSKMEKRNYDHSSIMKTLFRDGE